MLPESSASDPPPSPATIRCLHCDYDLRGLPGDPVRCPECGRHTSFEEYAERYVPRSKAGGYTILAAIVFASVWVMAAISFAAPLVAACGLLPSLLVWAVLINRVRGQAGGAQNWFRLSFRYQMLVSCMIVAFLGCVPLCILGIVLVMRLVDSSSFGRSASGFVEFVGGTLAIVLVTAASMTIMERASKAASSTYDRLSRCPPPDE